MRLTPPRTQPDRPLTDFGGLPPTEKKRRSKAGRALRLLVSRARLGSTQGNEAIRQAAFAFDLLFSFSWVDAPENCQGAGAVGS
ncbi:TPA: hypothetical protein ACKQBZ_004159, partial [Stenotrophomonas maltophilia]